MWVHCYRLPLRVWSSDERMRAGGVKANYFHLNSFFYSTECVPHQEITLTHA